MRGFWDNMLRWWRPETPEKNSAPAAPPAAVVAAPPAEQPWLAQLDHFGIPRTLHYPCTTLGRMLDQTASRFGDNPALVYNQRTRSYRELLARVNRMAGGLAQMGVRRGDRVVLTLPNCPEYVISFFALQKLGAVPVNAGPLMGADDLHALVAQTSPRLMIGLDLQAPRITLAAGQSSPEHFVWVSLQPYQTLFKRLGYQIKLWQAHSEEHNGHHADHITLEKLLEGAPARPPTVDPDMDDVALLQPTSGTTGAVKLVELTHRNLLANAMQVDVWMAAREGQERVLTVLPLFHVYGLMLGLIHPIFSGACIYLATRFDPDAALRILLNDRPTCFPMVPIICEQLSDLIEKQSPRPVIRELRECMSGAAPLPRAVAERFERLTGARVFEGYGLSETSPVTHANPSGGPRYGTIGLPLSDTLCRVVDLETGQRDLGPGQSGELLISGPQVMRGYFGNDDATRQALVTDAAGRVWLRTGDVVRMDEDGYFQVLDRVKDMIIHSGLKIYPAKAERVLAMHANVADVAVVGRPDPHRTEQAVAFIVLKNPDTGKTAEELMALCRQHLAPYEVPHEFKFVSQIPRSPLGKILKPRLRKELIETAPSKLAEAVEPQKKEAEKWSPTDPAHASPS